MRRLILMRHAKSSWDDDKLEDHARPLNKRGARDAPRVADALIERGWRPDLIVSSDATRTRQTWTLMAPRFQLELPVRWLPALYHGDVDAARDALRDAPADAHTILLLGHNPGLEATLKAFCGKHKSMTTANAALLVAQAASWAELVEEVEGWSLVDILRPKHL